MAHTSLIVGSIGVGILLLGFVLNVMNVVGERDPLYLLLNLAGSVLAAWYAFDESNVPFIVLELAWGGVAGGRLLSVLTKKDSIT